MYIEPSGPNARPRGLERPLATTVGVVSVAGATSLDAPPPAAGASAVGSDGSQAVSTAKGSARSARLLDLRIGCPWRERGTAGHCRRLPARTPWRSGERSGPA